MSLPQGSTNIKFYLMLMKKNLQQLQRQAQKSSSKKFKKVCQRVHHCQTFQTNRLDQIL